MKTPPTPPLTQTKTVNCPPFIQMKSFNHIPCLDQYNIKNWPVKHDAAAEARDAMVDTHCVVPFPLYNQKGHLIPPHLYKETVPGALIHVKFLMTHWLIGAPTSNKPTSIFVGTIYSAKILVNTPRPKSSTKHKTPKEEVTIISPSKKTKFK